MAPETQILICELHGKSDEIAKKLDESLRGELLRGELAGHIGDSIHTGEISDEFFIVSLHGHKEPPGVFNGLGGDPFEYFILLVTLSCRVGIRGNVTPSAVKQPMVIPRRPCVDIGLFHQEAPYAAQGKLPCEPRARNATPDDKCLGAH